MTRVVYDPAEPRLTFEGHAGTAARGADLVCAALSMLVMTLEARLQELAERAYPAVSRAPGQVWIACRPEDDSVQLCRECFETVAAGLALLARERPEAVRFERRREEESDT